MYGPLTSMVAFLSQHVLWRRWHGQITEEESRARIATEGHDSMQIIMNFEKWENRGTTDKARSLLRDSPIRTDV